MCLQNDSKEREDIEYMRIKEFSCVGSGIGGGFQNTKELHAMKYKEVRYTDDKDDWEAALEDELNNVKKYNEWTPRKLQDLPPDAKIITSTLATKNKVNDTYQASTNSRGHVQVEGIHYDT